MFIDSSLTTAQASAVDAPAACGSAASLGRREQQHVQQPGRSVNDGSGYCIYYSEELKREFCVFKRNWISARTEGPRSETWRKAHVAFFRSKHQFCKGFIPNERTTRNWWSQRHKYLTDVCEESSTCREPGTAGRYGGGRCRDSGGNVGIGSENNDSAGGGCTGWDDRMVDSHRSDAEHGGAFMDTSAADADEADAAHHHLAQVKTVQASSSPHSDFLYSLPAFPCSVARLLLSFFASTFSLLLYLHLSQSHPPPSSLSLYATSHAPTHCDMHRACVRPDTPRFWV